MRYRFFISVAVAVATMIGVAACSSDDEPTTEDGGTDSGVKDSGRDRHVSSDTGSGKDSGECDAGPRVDAACYEIGEQCDNEKPCCYGGKEACLPHVDPGSGASTFICQPTCL